MCVCEREREREREDGEPFLESTREESNEEKLELMKTTPKEKMAFKISLSQFIQL